MKCPFVFQGRDYLYITAYFFRIRLVKIKYMDNCIDSRKLMVTE